VLVNLLGNAIKFTASGEICLSLRRVQDGPDDLLRFGVRDSGIGIAPERQAEVFEAFTQADNSITRRFGGTGLGLTISNRLVQLMGAHSGRRCRLGLESELGRGSEFFFSLPMQTPVATETAAETAVAQPEKLRPLSILLAEDNAINQKLAVTLLAREGHRVSVVEDGLAAVQAWAREPFDLILMDMQMPGLSGIEATQLIRAEEAGLVHEGPRVPIVALTANAFAEDRQACLDAGMNGYVSKPIRRDALLAAIAEAVAGPDDMEQKH
jgi:CheY-like chemotaxis protein